MSQKKPPMPSDKDEVAGTDADNNVVDGGETTRMAALIGHIDAFNKSTDDGWGMSRGLKILPKPMMSQQHR